MYFSGSFYNALRDIDIDKIQEMSKWMKEEDVRNDVNKISPSLSVEQNNSVSHAVREGMDERKKILGKSK